MSERVKCETSSIFLQFTITVSSSNLNNYSHSEHQQYLYDTIKELHVKGWDIERFQIGLMKEISKLQEEVSLKELCLFNFKERTNKRRKDE